MEVPALNSVVFGGVGGGEGPVLRRDKGVLGLEPLNTAARLLDFGVLLSSQPCHLSKELLGKELFFGHQRRVHGV